MRTLQQRGYITEVGRDSGPGNAAMYGTTTLFLERIGMNSLEELPNLSDFVPDADVVETLEVVLRGGGQGSSDDKPESTSEDLSPPT